LFGNSFEPAIALPFLVDSGDKAGLDVFVDGRRTGGFFDGSFGPSFDMPLLVGSEGKLGLDAFVNGCRPAGFFENSFGSAFAMPFFVGSEGKAGLGVLADGRDFFRFVDGSVNPILTEDPNEPDSRFSDKILMVITPLFLFES